MKKTFLSCVLLSISITCFSQNEAMDNAMIAQNAENKNAGSSSQDDKKNLAYLFNGIANFVTQDSSSNILFNANLYGLVKVFKDTNVLMLDKNLSKNFWMTNTQFNVGVSPQTETTNLQHPVKSFQLGITFSILNNKYAPKKWFQDLAIENVSTEYDRIIDSITVYKANHLSDAAAITNYQLNMPNDGNENILPYAFREYLENTLHITNLKKYQDSLTNSASNYIANKLKIRPLLTVSCNSYYDQINGRWKNIDFSENFSVFPSTKRKESISLSTKYSIQNDTIIDNEINQGSNLFRSLVNTSLNFNYPINLGPKKITYFEIKGAFTYAHIFSGSFNGEEIDKYTGQLTLNIDIPGTKNFSIPISAVYDIKHPQFFGFISLQYSL